MYKGISRIEHDLRIDVLRSRAESIRDIFATYHLYLVMYLIVYRVRIKEVFSVSIREPRLGLLSTSAPLQGAWQAAFACEETARRAKHPGTVAIRSTIQSNFAN